MTTGIAVLGWAHGHVKVYCEKLKGISTADLVAAWDHDPDRLAANEADYGCFSSTDMAEVLARPEVEAVIVGVETSRHAEVCVEAARAGKHIALQKPMALTLEDCDRICDAVAKAGVRFTMLWQMRVDPQNLKIKELIEDGTLGRVLMFHRKHCLSTHTWEGFDQLWHADPVLNKGMWMDDAAHPFDLVRWLFGKPKSVTAEIDTLVNPRVHDDNGVAIFRTADGAIVEVFSSFTANAGETTTAIHGDKGTLIQLYGDAVSSSTPKPEHTPDPLRWMLNGESEWHSAGIPSPATGHGERLGYLTEPMVAFLRGEGPAIATAQDGRDVTEMLLASYQSAATGRRIEFPFAG